MVFGYSPTPSKKQQRRVNYYAKFNKTVDLFGYMLYTLNCRILTCVLCCAARDNPAKAAVFGDF